MIDYGTPPAANEIEVTIFGPGYGEAIAIHLGDGAWLLIDSCLNPNTKKPASEEYLDNIGVNTNQVETIVASHWHDDHVRGISKLATKYANADFIISAVFNDREAITFLTAYGDSVAPGLTGGAKELFSVLDTRDSITFALHRTVITEKNNAIVTALSPVHSAFAQSIAHFAHYLPKKGGSINHAPALTPNYEAIALHIDLDGDAILLGSDLEEHSKHGWTAVIGDKWSGSREPASAYKIAHHGSKTGDCPNLWETLLQPNPVASMTPWTLGGNRLPTDIDQRRIKKNTSNAFISSGASSRPQMGNDQLKRLGDMAKNIKLADSGFGVIRHRKQQGSTSWNTDLFGAAQKL